MLTGVSARIDSMMGEGCVRCRSENGAGVSCWRAVSLTPSARAPKNPSHRLAITSTTTRSATTVRHDRRAGRGRPLLRPHVDAPALATELERSAHAGRRTHITTGNGGKGGNSGEGGLGGPGGKGGLGGKSDSTPTEVGYGGPGGGGPGGPSIGVMLLADSTVVGANAESMALGSGAFGGSSLAAGHGGGQDERAYVLQG